MSFSSKSREFKKIHSFQSSLLSLKLIAFLSVLFYSNLVSAAQVTLAWDANTDPDLAGYMIYYGFATRAYDYVVDVGDQTTFTLSGLEDGQTYYFALTAYDTEDLESDFSNEVTKNFEIDDLTVTTLPCEGDYNKDGDVDGSDLAIFAADFGRTDCSGDCEGDFDEDGDVDGSDLATFAADFGRTDCPTSE